MCGTMQNLEMGSFQEAEGQSAKGEFDDFDRRLRG